MLDVVSFFGAAGMNIRIFYLDDSCIRNDVAVGVYLKWASAHPERMRDVTRGSAVFAMTGAFPGN